MEPPDQRAVLGKHDVRIHTVEVGEEAQQGDLAAREPGDMIEVDDLQPVVWPAPAPRLDR